MAKVTITIEDKKDEEGVDGLVIAWDSTHPDDEDSLANNYTAAFVSNVCQAAERVDDLTTEENKGKITNEGMN